jgi:hypothetical protein
VIGFRVCHNYPAFPVHHCCRACKSIIQPMTLRLAEQSVEVGIEFINLAAVGYL